MEQKRSRGKRNEPPPTTHTKGWSSSKEETTGTDLCCSHTRDPNPVICSTTKQSLHTSTIRRPPDSRHCGHRTRLHTPPPQTAARSLFSNREVGEGALRQSIGTQRPRRSCSECLCPFCCRSRAQVRSPIRPPAPAQCHCLLLWENGGDGGGGRGGDGGGGGRGGGGQCTGPARPAPQGQRGWGRRCPPPFCLWAAALSRCISRSPKIGNGRRRSGQNMSFSQKIHSTIHRRFGEISVFGYDGW
ncbi:histone-lysine N-methyltransferase SETD1A-like [Phyllostomus hastatus]|uniref:histone-lysine N-methyltransferase SETD1A-like n=1 Tax=Phyllostomus hastatus TaxID=9423 RepID=UPI001E67EE36|nr:histone-lysine N-methyltransferase SETD1A-like [Phyllostomus hastatus]